MNSYRSASVPAGSGRKPGAEVGRGVFRFDIPEPPGRRGGDRPGSGSGFPRAVALPRRLAQRAARAGAIHKTPNPRGEGPRGPSWRDSRRQGTAVLVRLREAPAERLFRTLLARRTAPDGRRLSPRFGLR